MPTNFAFLKTAWPEIEEGAVKAEKLANTDPGRACFHARKTLEIAVDWTNRFDDELTPLYDDYLSSRIVADDFRNNTLPAVFTKMDFVRGVGKAVRVTERVISPSEARKTLPTFGRTTQRRKHNLLSKRRI